MDRACLLLHGFSGGSFEVDPFASFLEEFGWKCFVPTLPGHEENQSDGSIQHTDWIEAAETLAEELVEQYDEFDLVGFSMGGLIAAYLANRFPVRRLILINTAIYYLSPGRLIKDTFQQMQKKNWSRFRKISRTPLNNTWQFIKLVHKLKAEINHIQVPTLVIQGTYIYEHVTKAEVKLRYFYRSKHLICLGEEADQVFQVGYEFLINNEEE